MKEEKEITEKVPGRKEEKEEEKEISTAKIIEKLPPELREIVEIGFSGISMSRYSGPIPPQFFNKINENHISKILEIAEKDEERSFEDAKSSRRYTFCYVLLFVGLLVFLTVFLVYKDVELYKEVFKLIIVYLGGLGSGLGINEWVRRRG